MTVFVCAPPSFPIRRVMHCPTCDKRRRFAGLDAGPYYGPTMTCLGCGDSWSCGERLDRPFKRGWRSEAIGKAKQVWERAGQYTRAHYQHWLAAELEAVMSNDYGQTPAP